jgi:hypothetical protein
MGQFVLEELRVRCYLVSSPLALIVNSRFWEKELYLSVTSHLLKQTRDSICLEKELRYINIRACSAWEIIAVIIRKQNVTEITPGISAYLKGSSTGSMTWI